MVTRNDNGLVRVTVTLEPEDVHLLDRVAHHSGTNRSAELRDLLAQVRPVLSSLVTAFDAAEAQRTALNVAAAHATVAQLQAIQPEVEDMSRRVLGMFARLEGAAAAADADGDPSAPASNTGATK